jgi:hypothetical protein
MTMNLWLATYQSRSRIKTVYIATRPQREYQRREQEYIAETMATHGVTVYSIQLIGTVNVDK